MRFMKLILMLGLMLPNFLWANTETIQFPQACASGKHITIAFVGDVLLHQPLQMHAVNVGFSALWQAATPYIQQATIAFANLEGPMAEGVSKAGKLVNDPGHRWDNHVYSSFPLFNYHPKLAAALKASGFDLVNTANNHTLDRFSVGVDRTIKVLKQNRLQFTGTRARDSQHPWETIVNAQGIKIAFIGCTKHTNGVSDKHSQVLHCYTKSGQQTILALIQKLKSQVDAVIITPHWGQQYSQTFNRRQQVFAHRWLEAGALAVIGTHPHCLQPMESYHTKDGRQTFIAYSLGNFVSYQGTPKNRASVILYLGLTKVGGRTVINAVRYIPLYMQNRSGVAKIHLTVLTSEQKRTQGYQIITHVLPAGNLIWPVKFAKLAKPLGCANIAAR